MAQNLRPINTNPIERSIGEYIDVIPAKLLSQKFSSYRLHGIIVAVDHYIQMYLEAKMYHYEFQMFTGRIVDHTRTDGQ